MKKYSILLADDEQGLFETLGLDLKDEGYYVTEANSGYDAIRKLKERNYDLTITDLIMDGVDGLEVLKEAKKRDPESKVVIIATYGSFATAVDALRLGASDYVLKPCDKSEMLARVSGCIEKLEVEHNQIPFEGIQPIDDTEILRLHSLGSKPDSKRLLVYTHDTFGLGNVRRMLAVCHYLLNTFPELSILFISGSPMCHSFRVPDRMDYIKLPCLGRDDRVNFLDKNFNAETGEITRLRSDMIMTTLANFRPHLAFVDKNPFGVNDEFKNALAYLKTHLPDTKLILVLRDILDSPNTTIKVWKENEYFPTIELFYNLVLILGQQSVFDTSEEYSFPGYISQKVRYCGYIKRDLSRKESSVVKKEMKINNNEKLVLVTPGCEEDGYELIKTYLQGLEYLPEDQKIRSVIICGPGMKETQRKELYRAAKVAPHVIMFEFTSNLMAYMDVADMIVSMGGYNTVCEILSLRKKAIIIPRAQPAEEQWIRAERMAQVGLFKIIHPDGLTPKGLNRAIIDELCTKTDKYVPFEMIDFEALPKISKHVSGLLQADTECVKGQILKRKVQ